MSKHKQHYLAIFGLLFGALSWGVIWYPYRLLAESGVSGVVSSFYTYSIALILGAMVFAKHWRGVTKLPKKVLWLCFAAGCTNLSYVLAVIDGEVMRVMLLFYLSPLWTLILAHFWLKESISRAGYLSIGISLLGAYVMLADPFGRNSSFLPLPQNQSEWLALIAGIGFSFTNVITRKSTHLSLAAKSMLVWAGVASMALLLMPFLNGDFLASDFMAPDFFKSSLLTPSFFTLKHWLMMGLIALLLMVATIFVQYGVTQISAARASVIFLFELIVAAIASYYLANEAMVLNEWLGGILIIIAGLIATFNHAD